MRRNAAIKTPSCIEDSIRNYQPSDTLGVNMVVVEFIVELLIRFVVEIIFEVVIIGIYKLIKWMLTSLYQGIRKVFNYLGEKVRALMS